jgi:hypothetical protein
MVQNSWRSIIISPCPIWSHKHTHIKSLLNGNCQSWNKNEKNKTVTKRRMEPTSETHKLEDTRKHGGRVWWPSLSPSIPLNEQSVQQLHYQNLDPGEAQTHHQLAARQMSNSPYRPSRLNLHQIPQLPRSKESILPPIFKTPNCTRNTIRVLQLLLLGGFRVRNKDQFYL